MNRLWPALGLAVVALVPAVPASAAGPWTVTGTGSIIPGIYLTPTPVWSNAVSFHGTATSPLGASATCDFTGVANNTTPGELTGIGLFACGGASYPTCVFTLTPTSFSIGCAGASALMTASYGNLNPTTWFTASGNAVA